VATSNKKIQTDEWNEQHDDIPQIIITQAEPPKPIKNIHQSGTINFFQQQKQTRPDSQQELDSDAGHPNVKIKSFNMQTDPDQNEIEALKSEILELRLLLDQRKSQLQDRNSIVSDNMNMRNHIYEKENEVLKKEIHDLYLLLEARHKQLNQRQNPVQSNKNVQTDFDVDSRSRKQSHRNASTEDQADKHKRQFSSKNIQTDIDPRRSMMMQTDDSDQKIVIDSFNFLGNDSGTQPASMKVHSNLPPDLNDDGQMNPHVQSIIDDLTKRESEPDISLVYPESFKDLGNTSRPRNSKNKMVPDISLNQIQMNSKANYLPVKVLSGVSSLQSDNSSKQYIGDNGNLSAQQVTIVNRNVVIQQSPIITQQVSTNIDSNRQRFVSSTNVRVSQRVHEVSTHMSKPNLMAYESHGELESGRNVSRSPMIQSRRVSTVVSNGLNSLTSSLIYPPTKTQKVTVNVSNEVTKGEFETKTIYSQTEINHIIIKHGKAPRKFENVHRQNGVIKAEQLQSVLQSNLNHPLKYSQPKVALSEPVLDTSQSITQPHDSINQSKRPTVVTRQTINSSPNINKHPISVTSLPGYSNGGQVVRKEQVSVVVRKAPLTYEPDIPLEHSTFSGKDKFNGSLS
jgi:hypothetical protein